MLGRLLIHPRRALEGAAARPSLRGGAIAVAATGLACMLLELLAVRVGGGDSAAVGLSIAVPVMFAAFWLVSGLLVGAGARLLGLLPQRRRLLAVTGLTFPVLVLYAVVGLIQAASPHLGGDALATVAGLLALPVVGWFVAVNAVAVRAVYDTSPLSAVAITLLPYAALSAVVLLLVVVVSVLHGLGAV